MTDGRQEVQEDEEVAGGPASANGEAGVEDRVPSDPIEDEGAEDLEVELAAGSIVAGRNANIGNTYFIQGDLKEGSGTERDLISVADVSDQIAASKLTFVEPASFPETVAAVEQDQLAVLTGRRCGNRVAAGLALLACGHHPVLELPAGGPVEKLVDGIVQLCEEHRGCGLLIHSLEGDLLGKLTGFELRRLRSALGKTGALAITTSGDGLSAHPRDLRIIAGIAPESEEVLDKAAEAEQLPAAARERAAEALAALARPVSPGTVVELVALAASFEGSAEELAGVLAGRSRALDEWIQARPTARGVAALAGAATLEGSPSGDFEDAVMELTEALTPDVDGSDGEKRFLPRADRELPVDIVEFGRATVSSHFGRHQAEVVRIAPPLRRELVVSYLWHELDADFRQAYLEWLRRLAGRSEWRLNKAAAVTAGTLFTADPLRIERELLSRWALNGGVHQRYCASLALGVPAASGADPLPARALARSWIEADSPRLRWAGIFAYGGPLGTWDTGADAAARLWNVCAGAPELQSAADRALASLVTGGRQAARARSAVFGLLLGKLDPKPASRRVYSLLPPLVSRLTAADQTARDSLAGLIDPAEHASLDKLAMLLVRSLDAPAGQRNTLAALSEILAAIAAGRVEREVLDELLIPRMRTAAQGRQRLPQFESQLGRLLKARGRGRGPLRDVSRSAYNAMTASNEEEP